MVKRRNLEKNDDECKESIYTWINLLYSVCFKWRLIIENREYSSFGIFFFILIIHITNTAVALALGILFKSIEPSLFKTIYGCIRRLVYTTATSIIFSILIFKVTKLKIQVLILLFQSIIFYFTIFMILYCQEIISPRLLFSLFFLVSFKKIWTGIEPDLSGIRKLLLKGSILILQVLIYKYLKDSVFIDM